MKAHATFFWQFLTRFNSTGAVLPSSRRLSRALVRHVGTTRKGPIRVLEAGPGTGVVTRELLPRLRPGDQVVIYEANEKFVNFLRKRFETDPEFAPWKDAVRLVHGLVQDCDVSGFDHAVCGVPFTNFPPDVVRVILDAMWSRLKPGGTLSFFEYAGMRKARAVTARRPTRERLKAVNAVTRDFEARYGVGSDLVLLNFPPAHARHCRKPARV